MTNAAASRGLLTRETPAGAKETTAAMVPMDTFKWIVTGLLGTLLVCVGWFLSEMRADLRDMRKEVVAIRVEAAASNTRLEGLLEHRRKAVP